MKTRDIVVLIAMLTMVVTAFCTPASAWPGCCWAEVETGPCESPWCNCACGTNGTVNGTVHVEYVTDSYGEFNVPGTPANWSRLYWHIWGGTPSGSGWSNVTFCNATGGCVHHNRYCPGNDDPNWNCSQNESEGNYTGGWGTHWNYWNVTEYITSGYNNASVDTSNGNWDGRVMWMVLVTVVEIDDYPETHYWINQGYEDLTMGDSSTTWFNGTINNTRNATLWEFALANNHKTEIYFDNHLEYSYPDDDVFKDPKAHLIDSSNITSDINNNMTWEDINDEYLHPVMAILIDNDRYFKPNLKVTEKVIDQFNVSCPDQTATGFVVNYSYDVEAKISNVGGSSTYSGFAVTLYDDGTPVQTNNLNALSAGDFVWTTFNWTASSSGLHTLRIFADSGNVIDEGAYEGDNNKTQTETVLPAGQPDLFAYPCCIDFAPAWQCNRTNVTVTVLNNGTGDAGNATNEFFVNVTMYNVTSGIEIWNGSKETFVCAKAYRNITFAPDPELNFSSDYNVTVMLDPTGAINEGAEDNNNETKTFHAIQVTLKLTHHYGNTSDYNGSLSDNHLVKMFNTTKVVTNYTTPWELLNSEADVTSGDSDSPYVYGINRTVSRGTSTWYLNSSGNESETCPLNRAIYWYCFVNGIPMPDMPEPMDEYIFTDSDVMHMDLLKYVNGGNITTNFKPRPIMDYPEPFLHGYNGTVWNTTIVYPSNDPGGDYNDTAYDIKARLNQSGVSNETINITTDVDLTDTEKTNNHLILLGTPLSNGNSIIADINDNHTEVGMPVYFHDPPGIPNAVWLIDDRLDDDDCPGGCTYKAQFHGVVMACDNPFNNAEPWTNTWQDYNQTVWTASGVTDCYAKYAADVLASGNLSNEGFWFTTRKSSWIDGCGDVNGNGGVTMSDARALVNGKYYTSKWAADVKGNGGTTMSDARALIRGVRDCCT